MTNSDWHNEEHSLQDRVIGQHFRHVLSAQEEAEMAAVRIAEDIRHQVYKMAYNYLASQKIDAYFSGPLGADKVRIRVSFDALIGHVE